MHGRIRWKRGRLKVEASPDAEYVLINGHKMATGSIDIGDEVAVGPCRIFLLRIDDAPVTAGHPARGTSLKLSTAAAPANPVVNTGLSAQALVGTATLRP